MPLNPAHDDKDDAEEDTNEEIHGKQYVAHVCVILRPTGLRFYSLSQGLYSFTTVSFVILLSIIFNFNKEKIFINYEYCVYFNRKSMFFL